MIFSNIFGGIPNPIEEYGGINESGRGLVGFFSNILNLIALIGGLFALFNLVTGGLGFITAQGNPESIESAKKKIYMSIVGLIIIVSAYSIMGVIGQLFFGDFNYFLTPEIRGPGGSI